MDAWNFAANMINAMIMDAVKGDVAKAAALKMEFVKLHIVLEEHSELERMQKEEPERFDRLLAKMGEEHFLDLNAFLTNL